jgi:hypothetical protein
MVFALKDGQLHAVVVVLQGNFHVGEEELLVSLAHGL